MSLLLLFKPIEGDGPEPPDDVPMRTMMGVGLTLALFVVPIVGVLCA